MNENRGSVQRHFISSRRGVEIQHLLEQSLTLMVLWSTTAPAFGPAGRKEKPHGVVGKRWPRFDVCVGRGENRVVAFEIKPVVVQRIQVGKKRSMSM